MSLPKDTEIRCGTCHGALTWHMERHVDCLDLVIEVDRDSCLCGKPVVNDPTLPDGWRLLRVGERIAYGDRYWSVLEGAWSFVAKGSIYLEFDAELLAPHIRRISDA